MAKISEAHPDHALLAACETWRQNYRKLERFKGTDDEMETFFMNNVCPLFMQIARTRAVTIEGTAAKARVFTHDTKSAKSWPEGSAGAMLRSILREVMAMGSAATTQPTREAA